MMFKRFLKSNFLKRSVIIITLTAVFTAVFSIFIVGFSADSFEPVEFSSLALKGLFLYSNFNLSFYNNQNSLKILYFNKSTSQSVAPVSDSSEIHVASKGDTILFDNDDFIFDSNAYFSRYFLYYTSQDNYGSGVITNGQSALTFRHLVDFPINFYLNNTILKFYIILPYGSGNPTFSGYYLDSDNQPHQITTTYTTIVNNTYIRNFNTNSILNDNFKNIYTGNYVSGSISRKYIQHVNSDLTYQAGNTFPNGSLSFYEVSLVFGDDYYDVSSVFFNTTINTSNTFTSYPVYVEFDTSQSLTFYEYKTDSGGVDLSHIEDMLDTIGGQLDDLNNTISGEMPSEVSQELESQAQQQAQLQGDIKDVEDKISDFENDLEWNRTYPEVVQENVQPVYSSAVTNFFSFLYDPTELIPRLIAFGSSMLILFTVFKRF